MKSIDEHIQKDQSEIESAKAEGNLPKVRHLTEELKELEIVVAKLRVILKSL